MPSRPPRRCPSCGATVPAHEPCRDCTAARQRAYDAQRGSGRARGYDLRWERIRAAFLRANPTCLDCGEPSRVADHAPRSRTQLVAEGHPHPDAFEHLQARCRPCHSRRTVRDDGGFGRTPRGHLPD